MPFKQRNNSSRRGSVWCTSRPGTWCRKGPVQAGGAQADATGLWPVPADSVSCCGVIAHTANRGRRESSVREAKEQSATTTGSTAKPRQPPIDRLDGRAKLRQSGCSVIRKHGPMGRRGVGRTSGARRGGARWRRPCSHAAAADFPTASRRPLGRCIPSGSTAAA